jgi:ElaB/YqjD/DUF883 family membrane-anchored ribosome-binding protein
MKKLDKKIVYNAFKDKLSEQLQVLQDKLGAEHQAILDESKSSAGDKYETQREMIQSDMNRTMTQIENQKQNLSKLVFTENEYITNGSLVHLKRGDTLFTVFVGPSIGDIEIEGVIIKSISPNSPLGNKIINLKVADKLNFNDQTIEIVNCY